MYYVYRFQKFSNAPSRIIKLWGQTNGGLASRRLLRYAVNATVMLAQRDDYRGKINIGLGTDGSINFTQAAQVYVDIDMKKGILVYVRRKDTGGWSKGMTWQQYLNMVGIKAAAIKRQRNAARIQATQQSKEAEYEAELRRKERAELDELLKDKAYVAGWRKFIFGMRPKDKANE